MRQNQSLEVIRQDNYLTQYGLYRNNIIGDGNCLFRSISHSLYGHENQHAILRDMAIQTIVQNIDLFADYFYPNDTSQTNYIEQEISRLSQMNTFAGQECILALAKALNINILVTMGGDDSSPEVRTLEHSFSHDSQTIHIAWTRTGGGHYESITETPPSEQFFMPCQVNNMDKIKWKINTANSNIFDLNILHIGSKLDTSNSTKQVHNFPKSDVHNYTKVSHSIENSATKCIQCHRSFTTNFSLKRHYAKMHQNCQDRGKLNCIVKSCPFKFAKVNEVIDHAKNYHDADIDEETHLFESKSQFDLFVKGEETKTNTRFIKKRKAKTNNFQLVCHRDRYEKPHLKRGQTYQGKRTNKKGAAKSMGCAQQECT